ncbi:MAG: hypothetical protein ACKERG_00200 [Candidatus Hodgkinia cicadicola]
MSLISLVVRPSDSIITVRGNGLSTLPQELRFKGGKTGLTCELLNTVSFETSLQISSMLSSVLRFSTFNTHPLSPPLIHSPTQG